MKLAREVRVEVGLCSISKVAFRSESQSTKSITSSPFSKVELPQLIRLKERDAEEFDNSASWILRLARRRVSPSGQPSGGTGRWRAGATPLKKPLREESSVVRLEDEFSQAVAADWAVLGSNSVRR